MKRTLIALSVAAAAVAPVAEAAPKVYGQFNVGVQSYSDSKIGNAAGSTTNTTGLVSNASRFGIKGEDELTAELSAVYQAEWEVRMDSSNGSVTGATSDGATGAQKTFNDLGARNRFVGLKHASYGQVRAGQFDSALKLAQGEADLFNDYYGDMKAVMAGENRLRNVIAYISPKVEGFELQVQHQFRDSANDSFQDVNSNSPSPAQNDVKGPRKGGLSTSLTYTNEEAGLYAAVAIDRGVSQKGIAYSTQNFATATCTGANQSKCLGGGVEGQRDNTRAVVTYKPISNLLLTAVYTTSKLSSNTFQQSALGNSTTAGGDGTRQREAGYILGSAYSIGDETIKLEYGKGEAKEVNNKSQVTLFQVGVDHNFTSKTKAFAWLTKLKADDAVGVTRRDAQVISVGLFHKF